MGLLEAGNHTELVVGEAPYLDWLLVLTDLVSQSRLRAVIWPTSTPAYISGREWLSSHYSKLAVICIHLVPIHTNSGILFNISDIKSGGVGWESTTNSAAPADTTINFDLTFYLKVKLKVKGQDTGYRLQIESTPGVSIYTPLGRLRPPQS